MAWFLAGEGLCSSNAAATGCLPKVLPPRCGGGPARVNFTLRACHHAASSNEPPGGRRLPPPPPPCVSVSVALPEWFFSKDKQTAPLILLVLLFGGIVTPLGIAAWYLMGTQK